MLGMQLKNTHTQTETKNKTKSFFNLLISLTLEGPIESNLLEAVF